MKMILARIRSWSKHRANDEQQDNPSNVTLHKKNNKNAEFYANYFSLLAGGARLKLVEAMFGLNLFSLFEKKERVLECDIIEKLELMPIRAKKWLHLLCCEHFLIKVGQGEASAYQLPNEFRRLMQDPRWETVTFYFSLWMVAANENLVDTLRFGKVNEGYAAWSWPPTTKDQSLWLEGWMTETASAAISCVLDQINFKKVHRLLDVGGGDGTMACSFAKAYPHLRATVYNLPAAAELARKNIEFHEVTDRVSVHSGNFIEDDAFPVGFDLILFSRVLFDWNASKCRKLLKMAYQALPKNGVVAICEFYRESSHDICLTSEYRYLFIDSLDAQVMKTMAEYRTMLERIGFTVLPTKECKSTSLYSMLLAKK